MSCARPWISGCRPCQTKSRERRALKSHREEDSKMIEGDEDEQEFQDVGSKGSRAVRPAKDSHRTAPIDPKKRSIKLSNSRREKPRKGASMRMRGGAGEASNDDESSLVSDATSSAVSSSSSSESARQDAHASASSARAAPKPPVLPKQEVKKQAGKAACFGEGQGTKERGSLSSGCSDATAEPSKRNDSARGCAFERSPPAPCPSALRVSCRPVHF